MDAGLCARSAGFTPKLDWSSSILGALGGMLGAVEMCNNNGTCRSIRYRRDVPKLSG